MSSFIKTRLGVPGVLSIIAVVLAMTGAAWAAKGVIITKLSQIKPSVQKQLQGKTGPQGPAGAAGAKGDQGPKGDQGAQGKEGPQGAPGKDGEEGPEGAEGSPWTAGGTLPVESTETGAWSFGAIPEAALPGGSGLRIPLSFPIQLAASLGEGNVHFINSSGKEVVLNASFEIEEIENPPNCQGSASEPKAASGHLCVYTQFLFHATGISSNIIDPGVGASGASVAGAVIRFISLEANATGVGTWAVTG